MIAEVSQLAHAASMVRIPPAESVPLTDRIRGIIDSLPLRRLASISQLGMVRLIYPGASHSRLEHSLGVYHNALRLLSRFADDAVNQLITPRHADAFVLAALIHDIGHWPFCHPIEDMHLTGFAEHESRINYWITRSELIDRIDQDWQCDVEDVVRLLEPIADDGSTTEPAEAFLRSCLSGPIDIDKLDYLQRDSLHSGVPYGRNFDVGRLIQTMCLHPRTGTLAISEKGRTAAEMMVFARYIMFSEVYWHSAVRSATAMLQRAVFELHHDEGCGFDLHTTLSMDDASWLSYLKNHATNVSQTNLPRLNHLVLGLFGDRRALYKKVVQFNAIDTSEVHQKLARRPYWWLAAASRRLSEKLSSKAGCTIDPLDILIDAPPVKLEVDINMDVVRKDGSTHRLGDVSPVAQALAERQFDDQVKRVRLFVHPDKRDRLQSLFVNDSDWESCLITLVQEMDDQIA